MNRNSKQRPLHSFPTLSIPSIPIHFLKHSPREILGWFEKFSESPLDVSASATRFLRNNHASFVSEHVVNQCSCCRTVAVTTLCCCFHVLICENGKNLDTSSA